MLHLPAYLFPNPSGRQRESERGKARLEAFWSLHSAHWPGWGQVTPQCPGEPQLYTGRQIHTHSQLGLPVIRQQEGESQVHTFTKSCIHKYIYTPWTLLSRRHNWVTCKLDSLKCCIKGTASANAEGLQWAARTYCVKKWLNMLFYDKKLISKT